MFFLALGGDIQQICPIVDPVIPFFFSSKKKDAAKLLKAKNRHDIGFLLVGDGASRAQLEQQAMAAGVTDMVVFTGRQPRQPR